MSLGLDVPRLLLRVVFGIGSRLRASIMSWSVEIPSGFVAVPQRVNDFRFARSCR